MEKIIRFKDLSVWLKIAVVTALIEFGVYVVAFLFGFLGAFIYL